MQNSIVMFTFFVFDRKCPAWANLVQIVNITVFFVSNYKCPFLGKFSLKCQNCQFKVKFASQPNSNMQNSKAQKAVFTFSFLTGNAFFWANVVQNVKFASLKANFSSQPNSNIQNAVMLFTFSFSTGNTLFGTIWSKK